MHSSLYGYAADGFPIYILYGYSDPTDTASAVIVVKSSYQLKSGTRASGAPSGTYDGTYAQDYEYVAGTGNLDECNGMVVNGQYGYFITDAYPWVLGCYSGTPDESFSMAMGPPPGR